MMRFLVPTFACTLLLASCSREGQWSDTAAWKDYTLRTIPGAEQYPHDGAIILLDEGTMQLQRSGERTETTFERHRLVRILATSGHRYANVVLPYGSSSRIDHIEARTIAPDGRITVLNQNDVFDASLYPSFVFFSDHRAHLFTFPAVEDGSIIEYRYRLIVRGVTYWHAWTFQEQIPVLISRFTLSVPSGWDVIHRSYGLNVPPLVTKAPIERVSTYLWEMHNIPPLLREEGMPPDNEATIRLAIAPLGFRTWDDVGKWYWQIVEPQMTADDAIATLADSLTRNAHSPAEKLQRLYEWVRDYIRYIAVEIGIGGYQPHAAPEVLAKRYGDCKDMVTLLSTLARSTGLTVDPVLVSTAQYGSPDSLLPSPFQFNHLIGYAPDIGEGGTWMDPTEKSSPFGRLPWYDQGLTVLRAGPEGNRGVAVSPRSEASANRLSTIWQVTLAADGAARVRGTLLAWGAPSMDLREDFRQFTRADRRHWIEQHLANRVSNATLDTFQISGLHHPIDPFTINYQFQTPVFASRRSSALIVRPGEMMGSDLPDVFRSPSRMHQVRFKYGAYTDNRLVVSMPPGYFPEATEWRDSLKSPFGTAQWTWTGSTTSSTLDIRYEFKGDDIPPTQYRQFREFLDQIRLRDLRELTLLPIEQKE